MPKPTAPVLREGELPNVPGVFTYNVSMVDRPDWKHGAFLFRYAGGKFEAESTVETIAPAGGGLVLGWRPDIPSSFDGKPSRMITEWVIEKFTPDHFEGVQQTWNSAPSRFNADRISPTSAPAISASPAN